MKAVTKICTRCSFEKNIECFYKKTASNDGFGVWCKKCSNEHKKLWNRNLSKERKKQDVLKSKERRKKNRVEYVLYNAKSRAKAKNLEFDLTVDNIFLPEYCPVLGIKLEWNENKTKANSYSIDRVDNTKGYTHDNTIIVSLRANRLKNDATLEELKSVYEFYEKLCQTSKL